MSKGTKKVLAVIIVFVIIGVAAWAFWPKAYEKGAASFGDLLGSSSTRKIENMPVLVSAHEPYFALIATPVALYYDGQTQKASPLLVVCPHEPSRTVIRFLDMYGNPGVATIGDVPSALSSAEREWEEPTTLNLDVAYSFEGSLKAVSLSVAKHFWSHSDGVIIVEPNQESYNKAVVVLPLASYLNIPVIITSKMDDSVAGVLKELGVRYSIVCQGENNVEGYERTKRFSSVEEAQDWTIRIVRERLGSDVNYITLANPMDIYEPRVLEEILPDLDPETAGTQNPITGTIIHSPSTAYPGRPELGEGPMFKFDIPYKYANLKVDIKIDISNEDYGDEAGARIYIFLGKDLNDNEMLDEEDNEMQFFAGSPAWKNTGYTDDPTVGGPLFDSQLDRNPKSSYAVLHTEIPVFNDIGEHCIQLLGKIPTHSDRFTGEWETTYELAITVEKLETYIYPRMNDFSSLAPYLTGYRKGVVLAKPEFMIHNEEYVKTQFSSTPASNLDLIEPTNERVGEVKKELNALLGRLAGMSSETNDDIIALADYYHSKTENKNYTYLGIIADATMVPHYYYPSPGLGEDPLEGYLVPGDNIYSDIDADLELPPYGLRSDVPPRLELADGRITGFNTQDCSALLCRTFFYHDIIKELKGPKNGVIQEDPVDEYWKSSGFTCIGTEPPVGAADSAARKVNAMMEEAGFKAHHAPFTPLGGRPLAPTRTSLSARQPAASYYESANFIFICAHGFWYWYVPPCIKSLSPYYEVGGGGAFDVAHVKLMNFGPSIIWTSSCVTGRIDGLEPYNCLSNAFLHAGMNCYLGGTRSMYGVLLPRPDAYSGEKLGDLMMLYWFGHMLGYVWDHSEGEVMPETEHADTSTGVALMLAKNEYIYKELDGVHDAEDFDTYEEVLLHGDPAFNPYEPNHEGAV